VTDMHPDTAYFAKVMINKKSGFHVGFSTKQLDSVVMSEMIAMIRITRMRINYYPL
jgi:hypothetical protein